MYTFSGDDTLTKCGASFDCPLKSEEQYACFVCYISFTMRCTCVHGEPATRHDMGEPEHDSSGHIMTF